MPIATTVLPLQSYGPGTFTFGPSIVPANLTGYRIEISRVNFQDPATAMMIWLDFSLDLGVTWLADELDPITHISKFRIPDSAWASCGMTPPGTPINAYSSACDKGNPTYPWFYSLSRGGGEVPVYLENQGAPGLGLSTRRVKGGAVVLGTVLTSMKLTTFP